MIKRRLAPPATNKHLFIIITGLGVILLLLFIAGNYPNFIENYYSTGFYLAISWVWHGLFSWLPFSIGDLFYLLVIISIVTGLWQAGKNALRKNFKYLKRLLLKLIIRLEIFVAAFYLLWGLNYFRPPAARILNLPNQPYTLNELLGVTRLLIDSANMLRTQTRHDSTPDNNPEIFANSKQAIQNLSRSHSAFVSIYPVAKPSLFTLLINYMSTTGYFNPFSGEAQVNYNMPVVDRPITACHEMAHQMGFAREDEANFIGFRAGIQSDKALLRYSAYYMAMQEFMQQVRRQDTVQFNALKVRIAPAVKADLKAERLYWQYYQNQLGALSSIFYDNFLKVNNQPEGLRTYNRMINLTMAYYRKQSIVAFKESCFNSRLNY